jgi:hypothetical protein
MKAVTSALAGGVITLGEAGTIAAVGRRFFPGDRDERPRTVLEGGRGRAFQELGRGPAVWRRVELSTVR